jgi:phosphopantetheinyl transferase
MYIKENKVKFLEVWTMKESLFKLTNKLISVDPFNKTAIFNNKEYKFESKLFNKKYILTICY